MQVGSRKLACASCSRASWLVRVGSRMLVRANWLARVCLGKFGCVIRRAVLPEEPFAMLSGKTHSSIFRRQSRRIRKSFLSTNLADQAGMNEHQTILPPRLHNRVFGNQAAATQHTKSQSLQKHIALVYAKQVRQARCFGNKTAATRKTTHFAQNKQGRLSISNLHRQSAQQHFPQSAAFSIQTYNPHLLVDSVHSRQTVAPQNYSAVFSGNHAATRIAKACP